MKKHAAVYGDTMGCTDISTYFWCGFVRKRYISISHINCFLYPYHSIHIPYQLFFCHIPWEKLVFETLNFQTRPAGQAEESDLLHAPGRMWCVQRRRKTGQRVNGEHVIGWSQNIYRARVDRRIELVAARLDTQILSASWRAYWMSLILFCFGTAEGIRSQRWRSAAGNEALAKLRRRFFKTWQDELVGGFKHLDYPLVN